MTGEITPLRAIGERDAEGWVLVRNAGSTYDDGVEDALYEMFTREDDLRSTNSRLRSLGDGAAQQFQLDAARANIVRGLTIAPDARVLEIGAGCGAITRYLGERAALVDAVEPAPRRARVARARTRDLPGVEVFVGEHSDVPAVPTYDVIVVVGVLEYVGGGSADPEAYVEFLSHLGRCLRPGGTLALAIENKIGVKYLVGAPEDHTDVVFDSIEGYPGVTHARTFSRHELEALFVAAGLEPSVRIAFPDYKLTRAVMDAEALERDAPQLLANLPSFPSADLRSSRPRLADEARVWRTLVDAGLAAETGNSFLVLAGKGAPQQLWPQELAAVYYSRSRREHYSLGKRVIRDGDELVVDRARVGEASDDALIDITEGRERVIQGVTVQEAATGLTTVGVAVLLAQWREALERHAAESGATPFDFVPNNLVMTPAGVLEPIDQEWTAPGWGLERVVRRGVLWFVAQLARDVPPDRWEGCEVLRDVARLLGPAVGLDATGLWIDVAIAEEAEFLAEVGVPQQGEGSAEHAQRIAADLTQMVDGPLSELPLGERLPGVLERVRGYLATAEDSTAHLSGEVERLSVEIDGALERERLALAQAELANHWSVEAALGARVAQEKTRSAETMQSVLAERFAAAEARYVHVQAQAGDLQTSLDGIRRSRAFRVIGLYYRLVEKAAPSGSGRRRAYGGTLRSLVGVARRLRPLPEVPPVVISIPASEAPLVSIVIPVHGKWEYTERCLQAVAATEGDIAYEVIVVDDASPDDTLERLGQVRGIRVVALEQNAGFVGACNAGIEATRGELVVLLNNDTRVTPGWLAPLVETVSEPGVGLVGSQLQYPDGRLQEAGGIVFSDGSGWNYGKFEDPGIPAYTFRRDVDYCSGASIIIRKSALDALGNLDTRYAPAYYDDTDLAFGIRELGMRVVYEPRSVVVHDEGVSHGTDETSGIKAYQAVNKEKFVEKWRDRLAEQCEPGALNVPYAARRGNGSRIVVVIDHYVPRPDEDSGSVRMMGMLRTLRELGYGVLFVPDNRHRSEPWTGILGEMGVEVFYGHGDLPGRLSQLAEHIHAVIVSRVTVAWNHVFTLRSVLPGVPLIFDTVDLHFLREERAAELAGAESLSARAETLKSLELAIASTSDTTVVVSPYEQKLLQSILPDTDVKVLPNIHYPEAVPSSAEERAGLLFVGSFAHQPNADGLRWFFSQVLPLIEERLPGIPVNVVGRDPDQDLVAEAPANVVFHGWVKDLGPLYDAARIAIAPLRYGAGVKGKIGEALAYGVPVVMTPIGAEGMSIEHEATAWVADDAQAFADGVVALVTDDELWSQMSKAGAQHIDSIFGPDRFAEMLAEILP